MRTWLRGKVTLLFMTCAVLLAIPAVALAVDTLNVNDLSTGGNVSATANSTGSAQIYLTAGDRTNPTGPPNDANGCNATADQKVKVALTSSDPSKVTINSPGFVELVGCDVANALSLGYTVTSAAQPGDVITVSGTATGGKNNSSFTADSFTITVVAPPVKGTTLTVSSATGTFGDTATLSADLDCPTCASGTDLSGKTINFTLNGNSVGSATTNSSGLATKTGVSLSGIDAGIYADAVGASYAGTGSGCTTNCYGASDGSATLTVLKAAGSVTIDNIPNDAVFGGSFTPSYTKAGDGQTSVTSLTTSNCTVSDAGVVSFVGAGTCTLKAHVAEGTNHLEADSAELSFTIAKAQATLTLSGLNKTYNGSPQGATVTTNPAGLNGVSVTYDGSTNEPTNAGSYPVVASLDNPNYQANNATGTLHIAKAPTVTTVTCNGAPFTYTGDPITPCEVSVTGAGGLNLTPTPDYSNNVNAGTATASYTYLESANHLSSTDSENFTIDKATAQVTLGNLGPHIWDSNAKVASVSTTPAGLNVTVTYNGNSQAPSAVGSYNVVATVNEQNYQGQATGTLVISGWTLKGFYAPVDYDTQTTKVWNTVKGGATVPLKFEILKGSNESSNTADVEKFIATPVTCPNGSVTTDEIEILSTGGTQLRYDTTAGQFIQNWQTPKKSGTCYDVTMQTDDGTKLPAVAHFQLK